MKYIMIALYLMNNKRYLNYIIKSNIQKGA